MTDQLSLIETDPDWRISEEVRETGRRGIARARAALAAAHATEASEHPDRQRPAA